MKRPLPQKSENTIVALFDVLGFESRLRSMELSDMHSLYRALIATVRKLPRARYLLRNLPDEKGALHPALGVVDFHYAYFSDTILLWSVYSDFFMPFFLETCCDLFRESIKIKLPLRGALAVGPAIFHKHKSTFLGLPLVDAARLEREQDWLGVAFCEAFLRPPYNRVYPDLVIPYSDQFKKEADREKVYLALDWTRGWRASQCGDIEVAISEMNKDSTHAKYYENTLKFFTFCDKYQNWYKDLDNFPPAQRNPLGGPGPRPAFGR